MWESVTIVRNCESSVRCEMDRQVCHLMESCDGHGGGVQGLGEV